MKRVIYPTKAKPENCKTMAYCIYIPDGVEKNAKASDKRWKLTYFKEVETSKTITRDNEVG